MGFTGRPEPPGESSIDSRSGGWSSLNLCAGIGKSGAHELEGYAEAQPGVKGHPVEVSDGGSDSIASDKMVHSLVSR